MAAFEEYEARANETAARELARATSPFTIRVRFLGGLTQRQKDAFKGAADRWARMVVGDLPDVMVDGEVIDDVLILAQGRPIDGPGRVLGQAGPTRLRPANAGAAAFIPAKGIMSFDTADLQQMEANGTLGDVITHEMGHVIGIGTIWGRKGFLRGIGTNNPTFVGPQAMAEFGRFKGTAPAPVPLENTGGSGTAGSHWRETIFRNELMTGFVGRAGNPLSRLTVASLADVGYVVNLNAAEPFTLPNLMELAERGLLAEHLAPVDDGMVLPSIPVVLPDDSLQGAPR